jgi:hypothetical protein
MFGKSIRHQNVSDKQALSIQYYKDQGYEEINSQLREGELDEEHEEHVRNIDALVQNKGKEKVILYRGQKYKPLKTFRDMAYVSTSTNENIAREFASPECCMMEIIVPENVLRYDVTPRYHIKNEREILLQRGLYFRQVSQRDGYYIYEVSTVPFKSKAKTRSKTRSNSKKKRELEKLLQELDEELDLQGGSRRRSHNRRSK